MSVRVTRLFGLFEANAFLFPGFHLKLEYVMFQISKREELVVDLI